MLPAYEAKDHQTLNNPVEACLIAKVWSDPHLILDDTCYLGVGKYCFSFSFFVLKHMFYLLGLYCIVFIIPFVYDTDHTGTS